MPVLMNLVMLLVFLTSNASAMQPAKPLYRRFALPQYNASSPEFRKDALILHTDDGDYGLPRRLNVRVSLVEDTHLAANFWAKKRHLEIRLTSSAASDNDSGEVTPEKLEMIPGPALWKSGVSWTFEEKRSDKPWKFELPGPGVSYTLDVRGDPDKIAQLEARLRLGTLEPYFENRLRTALWVNQVIGYESDAHSVSALLHSSGTCAPSAIHLDLCVRGDDSGPDRQTVYYPVPTCTHLPTSAALANVVHLAVPQPNTLTFTARNCAKNASPVASVLGVARIAAFLDAAKQITDDSVQDTITGEVKIPALLWFLADLKIVD